MSSKDRTSSQPLEADKGIKPSESPQSIAAPDEPVQDDPTWGHGGSYAIIDGKRVKIEE